MTAALIRNLYDYHFAINRKIWDQCVIPLTDEQFLRESSYSVGSVRHQVVHMLDVDKAWFTGLIEGDDEHHVFVDPAHHADRAEIRRLWDDVETLMRGYLATLTDEMLTQPALPKEKLPFNIGQLLLHVANHGTDHRAQLLRLLHDLGVKTFAQDYFFHLVGRM